MCIVQCANCRNQGTSCRKRFNAGDTAEVIVHSAVRGEVGTVRFISPTGAVNMQFSDGTNAPFYPGELRHVQHNLFA